MNKMLDWLGAFGRKLDFGLKGLGQELWKISFFAFRLAMVFLFFWYLAETIGMLSVHHPLLAGVVILAAVSVLCVFVIVIVRRARLCEVALADRTENGKVLPFLVLNVPFIFAVEFMNWLYHRPFTSGLLGFTWDVLQKIHGHFS